MSGVNKPIYLKPFVSAGEVFKLPDDPEFRVLPIQLFRGKGGAGLRIGDTMLMFDERGTYLGIELCVRDKSLSTPGKEAEVKKLMEDCRELRGRSPVASFYQKDSLGYFYEVSGWPDRKIGG